MGAVFRREIYCGSEIHVSTGKAPFPAGIRHDPEWSEWEQDTGMQIRRCMYGDNDCDLDDYR